MLFLALPLYIISLTANTSVLTDIDTSYMAISIFICKQITYCLVLVSSQRI